MQMSNIYIAVLVAVYTAIIFIFGVAYAIRLNKYNPRVYTLVVETYNSDFDESTYDVHKFISQSDRINFYDNSMECFIGLGREQQ